MNDFKLTIHNDGKERHMSYEASFMHLTAWGPTEQEAISELRIQFDKFKDFINSFQLVDPVYVDCFCQPIKRKD